MIHDFDAPHDRRSTHSIKWNAADGDKLPMGLADMDFPAAPSIIEALQRRVDHGIFGYTEPGSGFFTAVTEWSAARSSPTLVSTSSWLRPATSANRSMSLPGLAARSTIVPTRAVGRLSTTYHPRSSRTSAAADRPAPDRPVIRAISATSRSYPRSPRPVAARPGS